MPAVAQALMWSLAGTGLVLLQVFTHPDPPSVIALAGGYGWCFGMARLLAVSTVTRHPPPEPDGRPSAIEWAFAAVMVCFAGAEVSAAVVDLARGGGNIGFLAVTAFALLLMFGQTAGLVRRAARRR